MNKLFVMIFLLFTSISQIYGANKTLYFKDWSKSPEWGMEMDISTKAINKKNDSFRIFLDDEGNKNISIIIFDLKNLKILLKEQLLLKIIDEKNENNYIALEVSLNPKNIETSAMLSTEESMTELFILYLNKNLEDILKIIRKSSSFKVSIINQKKNNSIIYTASYSGKGFGAAEESLLEEYYE